MDILHPGSLEALRRSASALDRPMSPFLQGMPARSVFLGAHPQPLGGFSPMWISCAPDHSKRCGFQR
ncbi:hypothetical protein [Burkholderia cepacia]|uniref:Uncharacterized protein n=1 Tax=Burkholderia cepacia TaxID=292 RepID=A0A8I1DQX3_BURCE|nr:hypothetical protein [Burkholderia cepacia]MBH9686320.1 hypothetical protein [Burkholderia cepacia]MBH9701320.1 hypothetical protein [Burkholderia cepacia]MBH9717314.1 hypothetical protein [Burkholderia cepacia]MBH9737167.1 hypothetical protein [Burkholderia cepacia]MBX3763205.1 hypothetical protein [Burkholderia cepacia]